MPRPTEKIDRDTLWKLIEARCNQLSDAIKTARVPFLLALTWAFLWGWTLYDTEFGYLQTYVGRIETSIADVNANPGSNKYEQFTFDCQRVSGILTADEAQGKERLDEEKEEDCKRALQARSDWAEKAFLDSTLISFPGGFSKLQSSDLGIVGQVGLLLILAWQFYAIRRENHAIRSFVDIDEHHRRIQGWGPSKKFILEPQDVDLSAEHLAYAYQATAQRFVFLFSRWSKPLLGVTVGLTCVPALVATLHVISDGFDLNAYGLIPSLAARFSAEVILLILVWYVSIGLSRYVIDTGTVLNGWYLAVTNVWMDEWDETTNYPASKVDVDIRDQSAKIYVPTTSKGHEEGDT